MATSIKILEVITHEDIMQARTTLKNHGIKATVRKGTGSCRCQMYVTPRNENDLDASVRAMESIGFSLNFTGWGRAYLNRIKA